MFRFISSFMGGIRTSIVTKFMKIKQLLKLDGANDELATLATLPYPPPLPEKSTQPHPQKIHPLQPPHHTPKTKKIHPLP
jgi:hypothetical protein